MAMDIVWLKRDVRLCDHGPFADVAQSNNPFLVLFLYEPDQLDQPTVHGSHLRFIQEGLIDLDRTLSANSNGETFHCITVCHANMISTLQEIHEKHHRIGRILAHEETGHWASFMRDKAVRKWCRQQKIPLVEFNQTGVTRCLQRRDDYSKKFKAFMAKPRHATPKPEELRQRLVVLSSLPGYMANYHLDMDLFTEIPLEHRSDRAMRQQRGGETKAMATLNSFLQERGSGFSHGISSPNSSWTSCSRLSPYLSWGHISLRQVAFVLKNRQDQLRKMKEQGRNIGTWLRSLQAFSSRLHWRSHFIQKLESEPELEKRDLCSAYQSLRREDGDWNEALYQAWSTGKTGFPFVDACMRCLIEHGWINFRMRAMLVSFATYNLWLDWKRIAPHMARVFLDYEPGIHYPQLQMQSGTTGINAMRVYSVTKQSYDQDPEGTFIRKFVKELVNVPKQYIHEPWKMPLSIQNECKTWIGINADQDIESSSGGWAVYPSPIVNEQESARVAKAKVAAIRKKGETKVLANEVFEKHGSRNRRRDEMNGKKPKALSSVVEKEDPKAQQKLTSVFSIKVNNNKENNQKEPPATNQDVLMGMANSTTTKGGKRKASSSEKITGVHLSNGKDLQEESLVTPSSKKRNLWSCTACTFLNDKPFGLVCNMCGTTRQ